MGKWNLPVCLAVMDFHHLNFDSFTSYFCSHLDIYFWSYSDSVPKPRLPAALRNWQPFGYSVNPQLTWVMNWTNSKQSYIWRDILLAGYLSSRCGLRQSSLPDRQFEDYLDIKRLIRRREDALPGVTSHLQPFHCHICFLPFVDPVDSVAKTASIGTSQKFICVQLSFIAIQNIDELWILNSNIDIGDFNEYLVNGRLCKTRYRWTVFADPATKFVITGLTYFNKRITVCERVRMRARAVPVYDKTSN